MAKPRKPRRLVVQKRCDNTATDPVSVDAPGYSARIHITDAAWADSHYIDTPRAARALASWLLRWADWRESEKG